MKKLINEMMMFLVVVTMTSNSFATIRAPAQQQGDQKPLIAMTPGGTTPPDQTFEPTERLEERQPTLIERLLNYLGYETPSRIEPTTKTFSETMADHYGLHPRPQILSQVPQQPRTNSGKRRQGEDKYAAIQIPQQNHEDLSRFLHLQPQSKNQETVRLSQLSKLLRLLTTTAESQPTSETREITLKVTQDEANRYIEQFPELAFEASAPKNGYIDLRAKSLEQKEALLLRYKIQPELLKKFAPLMVKETLTNEIMSAGKHAIVSFPVEAVTFYIGIYVNTLLNLSIRYRNDPAAIEKFFHETTSPAGQLSFLAFMIGNRMFTSLVGPHVPPAIRNKVLPFFGMGIGSITSAVSHDIISLTSKCAVNLVNLDPFDEKAQNKAMAECQATYNQVVSSSNMHNHIASFMNIIVAGAGAGATSQLATTLSVLGATGIKSGVQGAALATGSQRLINLGNTIEGIAIEFKTVQSELKAYSSINKEILRNGKMTMSSRFARWFGYIPGKQGNVTRLAFNVGRLGWKVGVGIVIFLQWDEWLRPYTFRFEQKLMGSGAELSAQRARYNIQMNFLKGNNWTETICDNHLALNRRNGFKSFYTNNPGDCSIYDRISTIKEQSALWKDALLYKFMGSYTNWLNYIDLYQAEWTITQQFYKSLAEYIFMAKANNYDPKSSVIFNPLLHDDDFNGVQYSDRVDFENIDSIKDDLSGLTFEGLNKLRAQRVIDLLPMIGQKLREIRTENFKHKDWKNVEDALVQISANISNYLVLSETQKIRDANSTFSFLRGRKDPTSRDVRIGIVREHFSKQKLKDTDLPSYKEYGALVNVIDIINSNFKNYASAYSSSRKAVSSRDRSPREAERVLSLYDKAKLFQELRTFLGNPTPAARGEAFVRSFDDEIKERYTKEQLERLSKGTNSPATTLIKKALCGDYFLQDASIETSSMKSSVIDEGWGKNARFVIPRLVQNKPATYCDKNFSNFFPTRGSKAQNTALDYLMRNVSDRVATEYDYEFDSTWTEHIIPKLKLVYEKFDKSYQELIIKDFLPVFAGSDYMFLSANPSDAYRTIKAQPNAKIANVAETVIKNYILEMEDYLRVFKDSFELALKIDLAKKNASNATARQKELYKNAVESRLLRFNQIVESYRMTFTKVLLGFINKSNESTVPVADSSLQIEKDYASLLHDFHTLIRNVGLIVKDIQLDQKNEFIQELGTEVTIVSAELARSPVGEELIQNYIVATKQKEIQNLTEASRNKDPQAKTLMEMMALHEMTGSHFGQNMARRIESDPGVRYEFIDIMNARANISPYSSDRNMALPVLRQGSNEYYQTPGTLTYVYGSQINNQFLGVASAARALDQLMEEVYFNVNILMAANIDSIYRNIEKSQLDKYKTRSMGR